MEGFLQWKIITNALIRCALAQLAEAKSIAAIIVETLSTKTLLKSIVTAGIRAVYKLLIEQSEKGEHHCSPFPIVLNLQKT
jgi:hypothetical protein